MERKANRLLTRAAPTLTLVHRAQYRLLTE